KTGRDLLTNYAGIRSAAEKTATDCIALAKANSRSIRAEICQADISLAPDRKNLIEFTREKFGRLDLLVNNAGVGPDVRADILEANEASFDRLININVKGPYFLTQLAARWMIEQIRVSDAPSSLCPQIVTISSVS